jgi:hypothetical protein
MAAWTKNNWLPRLPARHRYGEFVLLDLFTRRRRFFLKHARTSLKSGLFLIDTRIIFEIMIAIRHRNDFSTFSARPAIKDDINFFLDFDFQPLYTFINCGFLLRTAHP